MLQPVYLVAFSGHRPNGSPGRTDRELENTAPHVRSAFRELMKKAGEVGGTVHLLSGIAAGADVVACEAALDLGIPLHVFLPLPEEAFWETFEGLSPWRPRAEAIFAKVRSDRRHTVRLASRSQVSPACYEEANSRMLDAADLLLTVSTGQPSLTPAGTQHLSGEADDLEIPVINIDPGAPAFSKAAHPEALAAFAHGACPSLGIFKELSHHIACDPDDSGKPRHTRIAKCLSGAAGKSSRAFRYAIAVAISLHAIAGFLAAWAASYFFALNTDPADPERHHAHVLLALFALIELILVGTAFFLELWAKKSKRQQTWLQCRFAREQMRGHLAGNPFLDPLFPSVGQHHSQWARFAIASGLLIRAEEGAPPDDDAGAVNAALKTYREKRVEDQIDHFRKKARSAHRTYAIWHGVSHYAAPAALAVVLLAFFVKTDALYFHSQHTPDRLNYGKDPWFAAFPLLFLPIFLPLMASLSSSFLAAFDFGRRAVRYQEMVSALENAHRKVPVTAAGENSRISAATLRHIHTTVRRTEQLLLHENVEWLAAQKSGFGH